MPKLTFLPQNQSIDVDANTKILAAATRHKIPIRFGCGSCRCGTCGIRVTSDDLVATLSPMEEDERNLLTKMNLPLDGHIRLACRARVKAGETTVDLKFQDEYSPAESEDFSV